MATSDPRDFAPTTAELARLVQGVRDEQLDDPTPCPDWSVADLVRHIGGLSVEFTYAAHKAPTPARAGLGLTEGWRDRVAGDLDDLATAWREPQAYTGQTHAGPVTLPGFVAAQVALNEVTTHAWDLARATGQDYDPDPAAVATCTQFVSTFDAPADGPGETDGGLFGPPVPVGDGASDLDRLVGLAGRDPSWTRPGPSPEVTP